MIKFPVNSKKRITLWAMQFGITCFILHQKHRLRYGNFREGCRVVCSFTQTNTPPQMINIVPNPKQGKFSGCFGLFLLSFLKTRIFPDIYFSQKVKASLVFSFDTNFSQSQNPIFSLTLSSCKDLSTCKEREAVILPNFLLIKKYYNLIGQEDLQ